MGATGASVVGVIAGALTLAKLFVFLFFLMALAKCLRAWSLQKSVKFLTILSGVAIVGAIVLVILAVVVVGGAAFAAMGQQPGGAQPGQPAIAALGGGMIAVFLCGCVDLLLGVVCFVWYLVALAQTRAEVGTFLFRR